MRKIGIIFCLIISISCTSVFAKTNSKVEQNNIVYMNIPFWNKFSDDILISNLSKVYDNNPDLKAAVSKVNQAQRVVKMSFANELPHIGFQGYVGHVFNSSDEVFGNITIPDYTETHFLLPLSMNYEVDIWGENRLKTKSKQKQFEMIKQDERAAYILISSAFVCDYYNLIRIDKLIELQKELIELQKEVLKSYEIRYQYGTATVSDIENANKNLTYLEEELEKFLEKQDVLKNQINTIMADRSFGDIPRTDFDNMDIDIKIPKEIDFNILEKRPDKIKSELDLERIGIDIKIAKRDMLPKFIITGNLGFNMYNISSAHKFLADIGVVPVWDIFLGGRKIQMLKLKKDTYDIAIQHYEKTILKSIQESNDALYGLKTSNKIKSVVDKRLESDKREMNNVEIKELAGVADNLNILLQKENLIISKQQAVSAKINEVISMVNLYQALGGVDFSKEISDL